MFSFPFFIAPAAVHARVLNQLLQREEWARDRLSRHSGKTVRFVLGGFNSGLSIQASGLLQASDAAVVPDVTLTIPLNKLSDLPALLRAGDSSGLAGLMHVEGDAGLAQVVSQLARELRWDIEEDLSKVVGDVAAVRLISAGRALTSGARTAGERLAGNISEYLSEESGLMAGRPVFQDFTVRLHDMLRRLDLLEARVQNAESAGPASVGARS